MCSKRTIRVCVLDSGLDPTSSLGKEIKFTGGYEIYLDNNGEIAFRNDAIDDIGHGTAVASKIKRLNHDVEIIPIKIVRNGLANSTDILITALSYIYENQYCDIVNISAGIISCDNIKGLKDICQKLVEANMIIVSAFDSEGAVSYPAAFNCVIGIDGFQLDRNIEGYWRCGKGTSNYIQPMREQRLPWLNNRMKTVSGTSFIAPEFTAKIATMMQERNMSFSEIVKRLDYEASGEINEARYPKQNFDLDIKRAIVFPFNKEMHSLARYENMLDFSIAGFYDTKFSGHVGVPIHTLQKIDNIDDSKKVLNIDKLDWSSDFDTVILGHTSLISKAIGRDFETDIINKCEKYNKKLFSCRDISDRNPDIQYYSPVVNALHDEGIRRMHVLGCPVLGVVGTGTRQGKFSLQLALRHEFMRLGYNVGQLGTEPTAPLFGMDAVYPMGHESAVYVKGFDAVFAVNQLLSQIEEKDPDIILFGSQSHTVTFVAGGPAYYPVRQQELLMGCQADAYVLVVCIDNPISYIKRNVNYLESIYHSKVLALAVSPLSNHDRWSTINNRLELIGEEDQNRFCRELNKELGVPVFPFRNNDNIIDITNLCIDYFS